MKTIKVILTICTISFIQYYTLSAQTPSDAIMMKQKEICVAAIYEYSSFEEYWEGTYLRTNGTIQTVKRNSYTAMAAIGIFDRLNFLFGLPYVKTHSTEPNGGKFAGAQGIQDLSLFLKGTLYAREFDKGNLSVLGTFGYSTPVSNYLSDYRPYSIGFGADQWTFRGIAEYQWNGGLFTRASGAFLRRGQTEAERDYYYNNGSYYSAIMDVPNAWTFEGIVGMWLLDYAWRIEASYTGLRSTSGDDIRAYNAPQPTNKVNFDRIGIMTQYYFNKPEGLGVLAYFNQTVNGRNVGKTHIIGAGLTYQFGI